MWRGAMDAQAEARTYITFTSISFTTCRTATTDTVIPVRVEYGIDGFETRAL